jgi:glycoprotein-N-acetylgalactosamine 3-beta-galactosyltransferase
MMEAFIYSCFIVWLITAIVIATETSSPSDCSIEDFKIRINLDVKLKNESSILVRFESGMISSAIFYIHDFCYRINRWMHDIEEEPIKDCDKLMIEGAYQYIREHATSNKTDIPCVQYEDCLLQYPVSPYLASLTANRFHLSHDAMFPKFCHGMYSEEESAPLDLLHPLPQPPNPSPRLLCMIFTTEVKHEAVIPAIIRTWGGRCTGFLAFSTVHDLFVSALNIPHEGPEAYDNMWTKVVSIWKYVYEQYRAEFDWFYIAGDDTFLIVENLLQYLHSLEELAHNGVLVEEFPFYIGRPMFTEDMDEIFNSGGAGYVLNNHSLSILYDAFQDPNDPCQTHLRTSTEDYMIAKCLAQYGIIAVDTRDEENDFRDRFHAMSPWSTFHSSAKGVGVNAYWTHRLVFYRNGTDCCSPRSISFHDVKTAAYMYGIDTYLRICQPKRSDYEDYPDDS